MDELFRKAERLIHLDLKSCPLKVDYLKQLFKVFKDWGGTGLLLEWEDTFPYENELTDIGSLSTQAAYSANEVHEILSTAKQYNLLIVPLVQTFGHLEFVLKTTKWRYLRECPKYCSSLCPSKRDSLPLITSMITQIMNLHPDVQFLHIGGDEVWHLGICEDCHHENKQYLFMKHILAVLKFIRLNYSHVTPIMWDDMLRGIDDTALNEFNIGEFVEPMIWEYHPADSFSLNTSLWEKYSRIFRNIWIASAFKGATGSCQILPLIGHHINNHEKWLTVVNENFHRFEIFRGIAITGWSRYDHYAVLCELLPTGLISLAVCLKTWLNGKYDDQVYKQISSSLGYTQQTPLILCPVNRPLAIPRHLNFPAYQIYIGVEWFANVRARFNFVAYSDQAMTWLNQWHVKRNNTSIMQVEHIIFGFKGLLDELKAIEAHLCTYLPEVFYEHTIEEWLGCYLHPLKIKMIELVRDAESQLALENC